MIKKFDIVYGKRIFVRAFEAPYVGFYPEPVKSSARPISFKLILKVLQFLVKPKAKKCMFFQYQIGYALHKGWVKKRKIIVPAANTCNSMLHAHISVNAFHIILCS
jgi:hypothetical protein